MTGGTGSFGKEFVRQLLKRDVRSVRVFSNSEYEQYEMQETFKDPRLRFLFGDIRDLERLKVAMNGVDIVLHAAAMKHVPICEHNPIDCVETNVRGSVNVAYAALQNRVGKVLAISTDKAVYPVNTYGASKLCMERLLLDCNVYGDTRFSCLRSGNFWGSKGSVIPKWQKQKEEGKPITITEAEMVRYWITLEEAVSFALSCLDAMQGGEIFIPRMNRETMGELARKIAPDTPIEIIGAREGEKLEELLFTETERSRLSEQKGGFVIC